MDREDSNPDITKKKEDKEERCILFSLGEWITKSKRNNFLYFLLLSNRPT
jgi:hypothetical protein